MPHVRFQFGDRAAFGQWYQRAQQQPSWVMRLAALAAVLVFVVPIILLTAAAAAAFLVVFFALSLIAWVAGSVANLFGGSGPIPRDDGRRNVRVIEPKE